MQALFLRLAISICSIFCLLNGVAQQQPLPETGILQIAANSLPLTDSLSQFDWTALGKAVQQKRFVMIGEFTHGAGEVFEVRNDIIRYLHEQQGFNAILFEAGLGGMLKPNHKRDSLSTAQMTSGLFGPWRTKAFRDLMGYVKARNIEIAGFDVQRNSRNFQETLAEYLADVSMNTTRAQEIEGLFGQLRRSLLQRKIKLSDSLITQTEAGIARYSALIHDILEADPSSKALSRSIIIQTLYNRQAFLQYMMKFKQDQDWHARWAMRDSMMAVNIRFLIDSIFPDQKIIFVGHNFHLAKYNEKERVMGEYIRQLYPDSMFYVIGSFARNGSYLNNQAREEQMLPPAAADKNLKHLIRKLESPLSFLDIQSSPAELKEWLAGQTRVDDTFIDLTNSESMPLAKSFDGLILLDTVSPPDP